jgi:hypothetical protein
MGRESWIPSGIRAADGAVRQLPGTSPEQIATRQASAEAYAAKLSVGGFDEALVRSVLYVLSAERALDERCALAMNVARQQLMQLPLDAFKTLNRNQFFVLVLEAKYRTKAPSGELLRAKAFSSAVSDETPPNAPYRAPCAKRTSTGGNADKPTCRHHSTASWYCVRRDTQTRAGETLPSQPSSQENPAQRPSWTAGRPVRCSHLPAEDSQLALDP